MNNNIKTKFIVCDDSSVLYKEFETKQEAVKFIVNENLSTKFTQGAVELYERTDFIFELGEYTLTIYETKSELFFYDTEIHYRFENPINIEDAKLFIKGFYDGWKVGVNDGRLKLQTDMKKLLGVK